MLKLERYKLFKRKVVLLVITGIFLIILSQEVNAIRGYKYYQQDIELVQKHKGIYTGLKFGKFYKDAEKVLNEPEISYYKCYFNGWCDFTSVFSYENGCGMHWII